MTSVAITAPDGGGTRTVYRTRYRSKRAPARRKRSTRRRRVGVRTNAVRRRPLSKFTLANINPFDQNADGCKIPDANTYPSTSVRVEDEVTSTTDAVYGVFAQAFRPYPTATKITATAASASSWSWTAAYGGASNSSRLSSITSNYSLVRPVAHGLKLYCPAASTTITGFVHVCVYAQSEIGTTWSYPTSISQMNNCMFYQRFPLSLLTQKSVTVVNKFLDTSATRYVDPSSDVAAQATDMTFQTEGWGAIIVAVESAPVSTSALTLELITHLECTPLASGLNSATPAAPYNIESLQNVSRVAGRTPASFVQGEEESYLQAAANALGRGAYDFLGSTASRYAYSAGRAAAQAGFGYAFRRFGNRYMASGIPGVTNYRLQSGFRGGLIGMPDNMY